ncbi:efflux RND transporter periplasmic adaptor subunit [Aggregatilineales bacterium SYSU G02658]
MSVRRTLFIQLLLVIGLPLAVFLSARPAPSGISEQLLNNLQVYQVQRGTVALTVSAIGALAADQEASLSFLQSGRVAQVFVQRDDYVLAGDLLMKLDSTAQELAYEQALLALEQAEMALQTLLQPSEDQIRLAEAAVASARGAYFSVGNAVQPQDITAAQLAYEQAQRTYNDAIAARDTAPPGQYDILAARAGEASFNLEIARLQLEALTSGSATRAQSGAAFARLVQAERELERVLAGPSQVQIEGAQAQIDRAEAQVRQAELALQRTNLFAPFDGVIGALNAEVGAVVAPNFPVATLVDVSPLSLVVQVDEIDIRLIEVGMLVRVRLDALPDNLLEARVTRIADVGVTTGGIVSYDVEIELVSDDPRARVGMTADATIIVRERTDTLAIPNAYIRLDRFTGQAFVNLIQPDLTIREVPIRLGLQGQDMSEVVAGLSEGDLIALTLGGRGLNEFIGG